MIQKLKEAAWNALLRLGGPPIGAMKRIPDRQYYRPRFSPWRGYGDFGRLWKEIRRFTLVSADRSYVLYSLAQQAATIGGEFWECGVFRGGTARLLADVIEQSRRDIVLRLFDTFGGMPETDPTYDIHRAGDFRDVSMKDVEKVVGRRSFVRFHPGVIPQTFSQVPTAGIALAHIDLDIYRSILDCLDHVYPRLMAGGFAVFDDYGFSSCPGARAAVDLFLRDKPERPLVLPTGQAILFRSSGE
jgi:O-methyltransferase